MKRSFLLIGLTFAITLAVMFGLQASVDALGVIIGVVLGVAASVPTTALVVFMLTRARPGQERGQPTMGQSPPVVIVNPPERTSLPAASPPSYLPFYPSETAARRWTVIGDTDTDT